MVPIFTDKKKKRGLHQSVSQRLKKKRPLLAAWSLSFSLIFFWASARLFFDACYGRGSTFRQKKKGFRTTGLSLTLFLPDSRCASHEAMGFVIRDQSGFVFLDSNLFCFGLRRTCLKGCRSLDLLKRGPSGKTGVQLCRGTPLLFASARDKIRQLLRRTPRPPPPRARALFFACVRVVFLVALCRSSPKCKQ